MPDIFSCGPFTLENVAEVAAAIITEDLNPETISVYLPMNRACDFIIKGRPAAVRMKLVFGPVQWGITLLADILATFEVIGKLACKGHLCAFMQNDMLFFVGQ